jgi:hypothetical protein
MSDFDHEHVSHLLNIVAQCAGHSGKLGSLSNAAMAELLELNAKIKEAGVARQKEAQAEKASKKQAAVEETEEETEAPLRPSVFPRDSQTATIADENIDRRL